MSKYTVSERLRDGRHCVVSRGHTVSDGAPVIIKRLKSAEHGAASLQREFEAVRRAACPHVIEAIGLHVEAQTAEIIFEDFGAAALSEQFALHRPTLGVLLQIAVGVAEALVVLHDRGIIHKDLSPGNIVRNLTTGQVKLIDFGAASILRREAPIPRSARRVRGTLAYVSPEQTGWMNAPLDARTDFYAFGATLYELLTGQPPFALSDSLEVLHGHIARAPLPPRALRPDIPQVLSDLVMVLLSKRPRERYQSARGLLADLETCRSMLLGRTVAAFPLRVGDRGARPKRPMGLYGRDAEIEALRAAVGRASRGATELLMVSGPSGVGKTALVGEVRKTLEAQRGALVQGKFEQFSRGVPYASLSLAFGALLQGFMDDGEAVAAIWRRAIQKAVGRNGRIVTELIPEAGLLLGPQPPLDPVGPLEALNRLTHTVLGFVRALAVPERPLILFLDDLQWADEPSLTLLDNLALDPDLAHVLIIGAYRDVGMDGDHPLSRTLARLAEARVTVQKVALSALSGRDVSKWLADMFSRPESEVSLLSELCVEKTGGNPFLLNCLLDALVDGGGVSFDTEAGHWGWELDRIEAIEGRLLPGLAVGAQPVETQAVLGLAALVGWRFELNAVAMLWGKGVRETQRALRHALDTGLILTGASYWESDSGPPSNIAYRFAHDQIQRAAHGLIAPESMLPLHLKLGRTMLAAGPSGGREFIAAEHFNRAIALVDDVGERARIGALNVKAGQRALSAAAYAPAHHHLSVAVGLMPDAMWESDRRAAMSLFTTAARAAHLAGDGDAMATRVKAVYEAAREPLESLPAREVEILAALDAGDLLGAISLARLQLASLGVDLPESPSGAVIEAGLVAVLDALGERGAKDIAGLSVTNDPTIEAACRLQVGIASTAYRAQPELVPILAFNIVRSALEYGLSRESGDGFGLLALFLSSVGRCGVARVMGDAALAIVARFGDRSLMTRPAHLVHGFVQHWTMPLRDTLKNELDVYYNGVETGDNEYACWGAHTYCANAFHAGLELSSTLREIDLWCARMRHYRQHAPLAVTAPFAQAARNLIGLSENPARLTGPEFDEADAQSAFGSSGTRGAVFVLGNMQLAVRYLFGDLDGATAVLERAESFEDGALATMHTASFRFYGALTCLAQASRTEDEAARTRFLARFEALAAPFEGWTRFCEANFAHKSVLMSAEAARVEGRALDAMSLYDEAIALAQKHRFTQDEALGNELAGRFHLSRGSQTMARAYLLEARARYLSWGAMAKANALGTEFPVLRAHMWDEGPRDATTATRTITSGDGGMDLARLFEAVGALTSEIRLDVLMGKVMRTLLTESGATRGYLLAQREGDWVVDASEDQHGAALAMPGQRCRDCDGLPFDIVAHVIDTGERLVLDDARSNPRFGAEAVRAVLCAPVVVKGARSGIVLLIHDTASATFTHEGARVVEFLTTEAAIAIENARMVEKTDAMARSFERFVPKGYLAPLGRDRAMDVQLGDAVMREVIVLFSDLRGMTDLFESLAPRVGAALLNNYLGRIAPIIEAHGGFIDKYVGDAIMALFTGGADLALRAAVEMAKALRAVNAEGIVPGGAHLAAGTALHTGPVLMGAIGSPERLTLTANGDVVNATSRLEGATRPLGEPILITQALAARLEAPDAFDLRPLGRVAVYGRAEHIALLEVFEADPDGVRAGKRETLGRFSKALDAFRLGEYAEASEGFGFCLLRCPEDRVSQHLRDRADAALRNGLGALSKGSLGIV